MILDDKKNGYLDIVPLKAPTELINIKDQPTWFFIVYSEVYLKIIYNVTRIIF